MVSYSTKTFCLVINKKKLFFFVLVNQNLNSEHIYRQTDRQRERKNNQRMGNKNSNKLEMLKNINFSMKLDLDESGVDDRILKRMADLLKLNRGCFEIHLKENPFSPEGLQALADALAVNKGVKRLYLSSNLQIADLGCVAVASALKRSTTLGVLDLANCGIGEAGAKELGQALALNKSLHTLYLNDNTNIGSEGMKAICEGLMKNTKLKILDVGNCNIGDVGCLAVTEWVSNTSVVEQLFLRKNNITAKGAAALADALATKNRSLKLLNLDYNTIGDEGARPFMISIRENDVLEKVEFDDTSISEDWKQEFQSRIARKQTK